jgi:quercetin dioxygenase-like cupin family protein
VSTLVERDRRWAVVGDEAGYLSTGPSAPRAAGVLALLGLVFVAVAVWAVDDGASAPVPAQQAPVSVASAIDVSTFETHEPVVLQASTSSYAPGQSSGWHRHPGLHLVTVVSGTLTVYDRNCTAATYAPGQSYLGGDEPHLARNETEAALDMAVTYLVRPGQSLEGFRVHEAPPVLCPVA